MIFFSRVAYYLMAHTQSDTSQCFDELIGRSPAMQEVYRCIKVAAEEDVTVLVRGESGTGKELVARAIHNNSKRSDGPFIPVNMGAMAQEIVPSEIFGHEKGAFTGAQESREGLFAAADSGTLFLDEVGSMDHKTQTSLLRILENREFRKVGGRKTYTTDARIIAATAEDLTASVEAKRFRRDLLYRLEVFPIHVPVLRDHAEDIPLLIERFIENLNKELESKDISGISSDALDHVLQYTWPGNVRELRNVIQSAMLLADRDIIQADNLPPRVIADAGQGLSGITISAGLPLKEVEKRYIKQTLVWSKGNKSEAAKKLRVSRRYLYNKIEEYNIG